MRLFRLLSPGLHLKRWLGLTLLGLVIVALGLAYILVEVYRTVDLPEVATSLTLQFLPRVARGVLFILAGTAVTIYGLWRLNRTLMAAVAPSGNGTAYVEALLNLRQRERGPKIVTIGGGTGMSTMLRGLKHHSANITAVVTVADDGGSSGRLRRDLGVLPPGDFRNCLVALADAEPMMSKLFQYRFEKGTDLEGHSFGNLFIVAMGGITGSFDEGIREASRVLAVRGQILPPTLEDVTLCAELRDGTRVEGESNIGVAKQPIQRVFLDPARPAAYPDTVKAIMEADLVIVGPGSLYTSILPNLLVDGVAKALASTDALRVYVCNVATQPGETDGFGVTEHVTALLGHLGVDRQAVDLVLANNDLSNADQIRPEWRVQSVAPANGRAIEGMPEVVYADVVNPNNPLRHSPEKLADAIMRIYDERGKRARVGVTV